MEPRKRAPKTRIPSVHNCTDSCRTGVHDQYLGAKSRFGTVARVPVRGLSPLPNATREERKREKSMSATLRTGSVGMEFQQALHHAVTLAWKDLMTPAERCLVRVEYLCEPGRPLENVSIWAVEATGYRDLVCGYWTSSAHPLGQGSETSTTLRAWGRALDFVTKNPGPVHASSQCCRNGPVQVYPPSSDKCAEAATRMEVAEALESKAGAEELPKAPNDYRQDQEALSGMGDDGHPQDRAATLSDATGYKAK